MNKEKQIKDMAGIIFESNTIPSVWYSDAVRFAETLYNAGYRKQSEGEWVKNDHGDNICSCCRLPANNKSRYCPDCGVRMKGGEE